MVMIKLRCMSCPDGDIVQNISPPTIAVVVAYLKSVPGCHSCGKLKSLHIVEFKNSEEDIKIELEREGQFVIDAFEGRTPASTRNQIHILKEIITSLEDKLGKCVPLEDITKLAREKGINEAVAEKLIDDMKKDGELFEPRVGFISLVE